LFIRSHSLSHHLPILTGCGPKPRPGRWGLEQSFDKDRLFLSCQGYDLMLLHHTYCLLRCCLDDEIRKRPSLELGSLLEQAFLGLSNPGLQALRSLLACLWTGRGQKNILLHIYSLYLYGKLPPAASKKWFSFLVNSPKKRF
jgi:hypothetical protein